MLKRIKNIFGTQKVIKRSCQDCKECCILPAIPELNKKENEYCKNLDRSAVSCACKNYFIRPDTCKNFNCYWKLGLIEECYKPSDIGVIVFDLGEKKRIVKSK